METKKPDGSITRSAMTKSSRSGQSYAGLLLSFAVVGLLIAVAILTAPGAPLGGVASTPTPDTGATSSAEQFRKAVGLAGEFLPASPSDIGSIIFRLLLAALLGAAISFRGTRKRNEFQIVHTNMTIAFAGAMTMIIIGSDLARAFGLVGASSIVRYRTPVRDPKALAALFVSMGAGIAVGVGLYELAILSAILVIALETLLERGGFLLSRGWYRPEQAFELNLETDSPEDTMQAVHAILDARGITHQLLDFERGKKGEIVKLGLSVGLPERIDAEELTLLLIEAGSRSVSWRQARD
jgi:uncharacterized membrane protein YhiD involved in acid resistance